MTTEQLHAFARAGAQARLQAISEERAAIIRMFPDLRATAGAASLDGSGPAAQRARKRRPMSAAERKAVGRRMRAYWAKRRKERGSAAKKVVGRTKRKAGMSAEARERQGERMRAYWAAKRAAKVDGAGEGTKSETAGQNDAPSGKRAGMTGRKRRR